MFLKSVFKYLLHVQHMLVLWRLQSVWVYEHKHLFLTELNTIYTTFLNVLTSQCDLPVMSKVRGILIVWI